MLEYELKGKGLKLKDLPEFDPSVFCGRLAETPILKRLRRSSRLADVPLLQRPHLFDGRAEIGWLAGICIRICPAPC